MWNQVHNTLDYFPLSSPLFLTMTHITGFTTLNNSWCGLIVMTPFAKLRKCWAQREKTLAFLSCKVSSFPFTTPPRNSSATNHNEALQLRLLVTWPVHYTLCYMMYAGVLGGQTDQMLILLSFAKKNWWSCKFVCSLKTNLSVKTLIVELLLT